MECATIMKTHSSLASDRLFCSSNFKKGGLSCVGCGGLIEEQFYFQVQPDLEWHSRCLKCVHCHQELGTRRSCFVKDGKTYCQEHYNKLFHITCEACGQLCQATDLIFRTRGHTFHWECLRCTECQRILQSGDQFSLVCSRIYCLEDYVKFVASTATGAHASILNSSSVSGESAGAAVDKANHSGGGDSGIGMMIESDMRPPSRGNASKSAQVKKEALSLLMTSEQENSADPQHLLHTLKSSLESSESQTLAELGPTRVNAATGINKLGSSNSLVRAGFKDMLPGEADENNCYSNYCDSLDGDKIMMMEMNPKDDSYQCDESPDSHFSDCGSDSQADTTSQEGDSSVVTGGCGGGGSQHTGLRHGSSHHHGHPHQAHSTPSSSSKRNLLISSSTSAGGHASLRQGKDSRHGGEGGPSGGGQTASGAPDSVITRNRRNKEQKTTRVRTVLNDKQLHTLRTCYGANPRPDALMKEQLVEMTGLSPRVIRVWFQNKRCKDKKRQLMMKQLELQQQSGAFPRPLTGIALVASSPTRNDPSLTCGNPLDVQQFPAPWKMDFCPMPPPGAGGPGTEGPMSSEHSPAFHPLQVRGFHEAYFNPGGAGGGNAAALGPPPPPLPPSSQHNPGLLYSPQMQESAASVFYSGPPPPPPPPPSGATTPNLMIQGLPPQDLLPTGSSPHLLN